MSNTLTIRAVESRTVGDENFEYCLSAVDTYGEATSEFFDSLESLSVAFPNRNAMLTYFIKHDVFEGGADILDDGRICLDCFTDVIFEGVCEDDSIRFGTRDE